jgi:hypothetical protein
MANSNAARAPRKTISEHIAANDQTTTKTAADFVKQSTTHVLTANDQGSIDLITLTAKDEDPGISFFLQMKDLSEKMGTPIAARVEISPTTARFLLAENEGNRTLSETRLFQYMSDMTEGRWIENGDGIAISTCGQLNNGQHRLVSIIKTGETVIMNLTVGLERKARMTNDTNLPKTASNLAKMEGRKHTGITVPAARLIHAYFDKNTVSKRGGRNLSTSCLLEYIDKDPSIEETAEWVKKIKIINNIAKSHIAFYHNVLTKHNPEKAEEFVRALATGMEEVFVPATEKREAHYEKRGLVQGDPRHTAGQRLGKLEREYNEFHYKAEIVFRAWNAWIQGREIKHIVVKNELPKLL